MKKKSLFGINVKLTLMLVAICGMFASCYEKEELTTEAPSTVAPVYKIAGVVSNAATGAPLEGVKVNDVTTAADGTYTLIAKEGMNVLKITKEDFQTVTTSVYVEKIANGQVSVYTANAAMYPGKDAPTYKTVKYNIKGTATDESGAKVVLTSVVIPGLDVTPTGNTFAVEGIQPGTYYAVLTANGYKNAYATINIASVAAEEGEGDQIVNSAVAVLMQKEDAAKVARYFVCGFVTNEEGAAVNGAEVKVNIGTSTENLITNGYGYFSVEVPAERVAPTTLAVVTVSKGGYATQAKASIVKFVETGATSVTSFEIVLKVKGGEPVPPEDPSVGGSTEVEVPIDKAEETTVEDIKKTEDETVVNKIEEIAKELGVDVTKEFPVVPVEEPLVVELVSKEVIIDEETGEMTSETKDVADQIALPANTNVYYVAGTAEPISVTRDIPAEKATASVRTYEGKPSGTVFSKPMEIKFPAPVTITVEPDYVLGVLYLDEKTGEWKADAGNYAEYDMTSKTFVGNISHFSKFRFGYESEINSKESIVLKDDPINKPCYTGSASANVTVNGSYMGGTAYDEKTPDMAVEAALSGMNAETKSYVTTLLKNMIKVDYANVMPTNAYVKTALSTTIVVPAYKQIDSFSLERKQVKKSYTVHVIDKNKKVIDVTVVVKRIVSYTLTPNYAIGHTHGHGGNGEDLNAGGGIINFE